MVRAPAGAFACGPTSVIVLPSITTVAFGTDPRPVPSMSVTPRMTMTLFCADVIAAAARKATAKQMNRFMVTAPRLSECGLCAR